MPYDILRKYFACNLKMGLYNVDIERTGERKMETTVLIFDRKRKGNKYKVYQQTNYPNGWSRRLLATFKTSAEAERFMNSR